jgi:HK97 family phage portal protein
MAIVENADGLVSVQANNLLNRPDLSGQISLFDGRGIDYADLYKAQHEVRSVVDFLARNISQIPLHAYRRDGDNSRSRITGTSLTQTLEQPDIYTTRSRWMEGLVKDLCIYDEAIRVKVRSGDRIALVRVPPNMVQALGDNWLRPEGYRIKGTNGTIDYTRDQVIHIHGYNPKDLRKGLSPLETLRQLLAEQQAAAEHREGLWRQGARASLVIERPIGAPQWSDTARARFRADWDASFTGAKNSGKTAVLEEGMIAKPLQTFSPRDAQYLESNQLAREIVAAAYGVPAGLLGLGNANYSSLTEQHRQLYTDCLAPWLTIISEELEAQLLPEFNEPNAYLEFQLQEKLRGSFEEQAGVLQASVGAPYLTRNEARARLNLPAIDGGDDLVTPLNVLVGGLASPQDTVSDERTLGTLSADNVEAKAASLPDGEKQAISRQTFLEIRQSGADSIAQVLKDNLERQSRSVASRLGAAKSAEVKADARRVYDRARFDKELAADLLPALTRVTSRSAKIVGEWDVDNARNYLAAVADGAAKRINKATQDRLSRRFADLGDEDSPVDIAREMFEEMGDADTVGSSFTLATAMANFGRIESAQANNRGTKTWIVTSGNPRGSHAALNGETVAISDTFSNGARWPGDPDLDDDERANCQCMVDFVG